MECQRDGTLEMPNELSTRWLGTFRTLAKEVVGPPPKFQKQVAMSQNGSHSCGDVRKDNILICAEVAHNLNMSRASRATD